MTEHKNQGFTLAEVLITLGVIGVVAAMTLPTLLTNIQQRVKNEQIRDVQYKFTKYIGLFVQPSLGYYFDNGSAIKTYYDEHRFTPTVNLGIKVNL